MRINFAILNDIGLQFVRDRKIEWSWSRVVKLNDRDHMSRNWMIVITCREIVIVFEEKRLG